MLAEVFEPFVKERPVSVMARGALERLLSPDWVDEVFEANAEEQYTRELLFSTLFTLMVRVVFGHAKTVRRAYLANVDHIAVSLTSIYNKLNGVEARTSAALVNEAGRTSDRLIRKMGGCREPLLPGYRVLVLDGNALAGTQHRIKELRELAAGALPGKALVVYSPETGCAVGVVPCEDGHTQERALLEELLPSMERGELWIADRNFCTRRFLFGAVERGADILVREHKNLPAVEIGPERSAGKTDTGSLSEQEVEVTSDDGQRVLRLRRVIIRLTKPTRDGDRVVNLLCTLPREVKAKKIAELYRKRWGIETAFQELQRDLHSEIDTLGYPRAALFGFCVALVAYNIMALVYGALRAEHGATRIDEEFSHYYLADELQMTYDGMMIAIPDVHWSPFAEMSDGELVDTLLFLASKVNLKRFPKSRRGPKKPRPKRKSDPKTPHVSTAKILTKRERGTKP